MSGDGGSFTKIAKESHFDSIVVTTSIRVPEVTVETITITSPPTVPTDAVNKEYVDNLLIGAVSGPVTTTDRAIAVWSGTGGGSLDDAPVTIDVAGNVFNVASITLVPFGTVDGRDIGVDGATLDAHVGDTSTNPHAVTKAQVGLALVPNVRQNLSALVAPTVNDDASANYAVGSRWIDGATNDEYVCTDPTIGAAVWKSTTSGGGGGTGNLLLAGNTISSTDPNGDINILPDGSGEVFVKADPVSPLGVATKAYVDLNIGGGGGKTSVALDDVTWTTVAGYVRGGGRIAFCVAADGYPVVTVDVGKSNSLSSAFSEHRTCNLYGTGGTTIQLRWTASGPVEAQTSAAGANATYVVTVNGFT